MLCLHLVVTECQYIGSDGRKCSDVLRGFITVLHPHNWWDEGKLCWLREECRMFLFFFVSLFLLTHRLCWWATSACIVPLRQQWFANGFYFYLLRYQPHSRVRTYRHVAKRPCPVSDPMVAEPSPPTGEGSKKHPATQIVFCPLSCRGRRHHSHWIRYRSVFIRAPIQQNISV